MSEFSESYHLQADDPAEAVALLRQAKHQGFVYPAESGWVTFVAADGDFTADEKIVQANPGFLLHYVYAEDHGWNFSFFEKKQLRLKYTCEWDDEVRIDDAACPQARFRALVKDFGTGDAAEIWPLLQPADIDTSMEEEAAKNFADAMALPHYEWLSYDYLAKDFAKGPEKFPGLIQIK